MRYETVNLRASAEERSFLYDAYVGGRILAYRDKQVRVVRATRDDATGDWEFTLEILGGAARGDRQQPGSSSRGGGGSGSLSER